MEDLEDDCCRVPAEAVTRRSRSPSLSSAWQHPAGTWEAALPGPKLCRQPTETGIVPALPPKNLRALRRLGWLAEGCARPCLYEFASGYTAIVMIFMWPDVLTAIMFFVFFALYLGIPPLSYRRWHPFQLIAAMIEDLGENSDSFAHSEHVVGFLTQQFCTGPFLCWTFIVGWSLVDFASFHSHFKGTFRVGEGLHSAETRAFVILGAGLAFSGPMALWSMVYLIVCYWMLSRCAVALIRAWYKDVASLFHRNHCEGDLERLHSLEAGLRSRIDEINTAWSWIITYLLGLIGVFIGLWAFMAMTLTGFLQVIGAVFAFAFVIIFFVALYSMARVADVWLEVVKALDTPRAVVRSAEIFGPHAVRYSSRLRDLEDMGFVVAGVTVTSPSVLKLVFAVLVSLLLSFLSSSLGWDG